MESRFYMPDDKNKKKPQDASRINLSQQYEIAYWCDTFECSEKELRDAVDKVGTSSKAVKDYLNRK